MVTLLIQSTFCNLRCGSYWSDFGSVVVYGLCTLCDYGFIYFHPYNANSIGQEFKFWLFCEGMSFTSGCSCF